MKKVYQYALLFASLCLGACSLTPEQHMMREMKQRKAEQALQIKLAKQCDIETAELMAEQFSPPLSRTAEQQKAFEQRYTEKVNNPVFQACYKLALTHYKMQEELEYMRHYYDEDRPRLGFPRFCHFCR